MRRQRNRPQVKEQENSPEKLDEMHTSNLSHREFRIMIIRILNYMKKDLETIKNDQSEIKNAISEINNTLEGLKSRLHETQDRKNTQPEHQNKKEF